MSTDHRAPPPYVAVVGPGEGDDLAVEQAEVIGRILGDAGAVVICGGLGGVMAAACRGVKSAGGGRTVGLLPGSDRSAANPWVDVAIPTGLGEARNALVVRAADAVIAIAGEFGTLSELALALKAGTPVVGLGTWELSKRGERVTAFVEASSPEEAAALALELARSAT